MSNSYEDIIKEITKNHQILHNTDISISKDISSIKKSIKNIEEKIYHIDDTVNKMFDILNTISIFLEEAEDQGELDSDEDGEDSWNPYGTDSHYEEYYKYDDDEDKEDY